MKNHYSLSQKIAAWSVHLFTASGIIFALLAIIAIAHHEFVDCMFYLVIAFIIDGVDGTLARKFKVKEVLPYMEGKNIDFVIDFATYAIIPAYFLYEAFWVIGGQNHHLLPENNTVKLITTSILLLVSAIYYGKEPMVSKDMYFIGFPVMWNAVAFYMFFVIRLDAWMNVLVIIIFAILHFIPLKWAYPSQNKRFKYLNLGVGTIFLITNGLIMFYYPNEPIYLRYISALTLPYFIWNTLWVSFR